MKYNLKIARFVVLTVLVAAPLYASAGGLFTDGFLFKRINADLLKVAGVVVRKTPALMAEFSANNYKIISYASANGIDLPSLYRQMKHDVSMLDTPMPAAHREIVRNQFMSDYGRMVSAENKVLDQHPAFKAKVAANHKAIIAAMAAVNPNVPALIKQIRGTETPIRKSNPTTLW